MDNNFFDVAVIGGGAAGLAAAITYARRERSGSLVLIEANEVLGKKLLATGNGRCNISNLSADGYAKTKRFFESVGVLLRVEDGGRAYPMSGQALSVRNALVLALEREQVQTLLGARVSKVTKGEKEFTLDFADGTEIKAKKLIIAAGGKAGPQFGCLGDGYAFARALGHGVESIRPALVPLVYTEKERDRLAGLKGVRIRSQAELFIDNKRAAASSGELQFTEYGLSGIMIFDLSTMMPKSIIEGKPSTEVVLDFVPGEEKTSLERLIQENEGLWLEGVVGKKLSDLLVSEAGGNVSRIAALAKEFPVTVEGTKGWKEAQVTHGGVRLSDVNEETGESLLCEGLYFAGEILDPVFICGGFNLNFAWSTGLRAGENI